MLRTKDPQRSTALSAADGEGYLLTYFGGAQPYRATVTVPAGRTGALDVIDTWNMTVEQVATGVSGGVEVPLPSRPWMAVRVRCDWIGGCSCMQ
ncbi:DUF5605 domain-containing protein [Actinomyces sp.]|uniref:DUF5605 domain-containing protein n=1 Tax=Actinomyces sp. TaxID=29317 RepID=UPI0034C5D114